MSSFQHTSATDEEGDKEGFFEWIVAFEDVRHYFTPRYTGLPGVAAAGGEGEGGEENNKHLRALEIGCGTSGLAVDLSQKLHFGEVVSIDNDKGCVDHMSKAHKNVAGVQWIVFDVIEDVHKFTHTVLDNDSYFDIIVDKGTLDAVLVEGTIAAMLEWVKRKLKVNGVYILFSIWSKSLLEPLFGIKELEYCVFIEEIAVSEYKRGTVVICRKMSDDITINMQGLMEQEKSIMDVHFKEEDPLLTPEVEIHIRRAFALAAGRCGNAGGGGGGGEHSMRLKDVYDVIFGCGSIGASGEEEEIEGTGGKGQKGNEKVGAFTALSGFGFTLDLFLEDLTRFPRSNEDELTLEETLQFIRQMQ